MGGSRLGLPVVKRRTHVSWPSPYAGTACSAPSFVQAEARAGRGRAGSSAGKGGAGPVREPGVKSESSRPFPKAQVQSQRTRTRVGKTRNWGTRTVRDPRGPVHSRRKQGVRVRDASRAPESRAREQRHRVQSAGTETQGPSEEREGPDNEAQGGEEKKTRKQTNEPRLADRLGEVGAAGWWLSAHLKGGAEVRQREGGGETPPGPPGAHLQVPQNNPQEGANKPPACPRPVLQRAVSRVKHTTFFCAF